MKRLFIFIATCSSLPMLYSSDHETTPLIPNNEYVIASPKKRIFPSCLKVYTEYPCTQRSYDALVGCVPAFLCLGTREGITDCCVWAPNELLTFKEAHNQMWCTPQLWFPWCCNSRQEVCTTIAGNASTAITLASIAYSLSMFLPCTPKKCCSSHTQTAIN